MSAATEYVFAALRGTVKTIEEKVDHDVHGKEIKSDIARMVSLVEGDPVPANIAKDELERLLRLGLLVKAGEPTLTEKAMGKAKEGGTTGGGIDGAPAIELDLAKLGEYAADELATAWAAKQPTVSAVLEQIGGVEDASTKVELAKKALAAEHAATKGDGRKTLVAGLEKVIAGATS